MAKRATELYRVQIHGPTSEHSPRRRLHCQFGLRGYAWTSTVLGLDRSTNGARYGAALSLYVGDSHDAVPPGEDRERASHAYVMLDLLLTCETITDALRQTKLRMTRRPRSQLRSPPPVDGRFDCASASSRLFVNCDESQDESIGPFQRLICGQSDCMDNSKLWSDPRRPCWASVR